MNAMFYYCAHFIYIHSTIRMGERAHKESECKIMMMTMAVKSNGLCGANRKPSFYIQRNIFFYYDYFFSIPTEHLLSHFFYSCFVTHKQAPKTLTFKSIQIYIPCHKSDTFNVNTIEYI